MSSCSSSPLTFTIQPGYRAGETTFVQELLEQLGFTPHTDALPYHSQPPAAPYAGQYTAIRRTAVRFRWCRLQHSFELDTLRADSRRNFLPGIIPLCVKDRLHALLLTQRRSVARDSVLYAALQFWPLSYRLAVARERTAFLKEFDAAPQRVWILKRAAAARGEGVYLANSKAQLDQLLLAGGACHPLTRVRPLAQLYVDNVLLLGAHKFTFRIYALVTSVDPLRVYVFEEGLTRICSRAYPGTAAVDDKMAHIDSIDLNEVNADAFERTAPADLEHDGLRCLVRYTLRYLQRHGAIESAERVWQRIKQVVALTLCAAETSISNGVRESVPFRANCFDLLGFDLLLDDTSAVHLLEVNHAPSLTPLTDMENAVKRKLLRDAFVLADVLDQRRQRVQQALAAWHERADKRADLECFSDEDVWVAVDTHLEHQQSLRDDNGFERVLPPNTDQESDLYAAVQLPNRNVLVDNCRRESLFRELLGGA